MPRFTFRCQDIGNQCSFETEAGKPEDLMPRIRMHAKYAHGIYELSEDLQNKIKGAIKQVD
ncbi:MAG TPA: DUF1059 domain-containing protein [Thermoplasmataceae archaeon]|nr:DUF1059 domain-containing protein [Thermoplasmatales archaeon AK]HLH86390.1 DUF1059 domain-containing protein [Thermoplasmataceae archaeon]